MIIGNVLTAQDKTGSTLGWELAATLPPDTNDTVALGVAGPVTGVHHGVLFVGGGANFPEGMPWMGGKKKYHSTLYAFTHEADGKLKPEGTYALPGPVAYSACSGTDSGVVYAGGENEDGLSKKVFLLQWDNASKKVAINTLPDLPVAITNASLVVEENRIYLAGGETTEGTTDIFLCLDLQDNNSGWEELPSLPKPVSHALLVSLQNDKGSSLFLIGGRKKNENGISDLYSTVYAFDFTGNKWKQQEPLPYPLSAGTGVVIEGKTILLFGGDKGETFHRTEKLIAAIAKENDQAIKEQLNQQKIKVQTSHPGFSNEVLQFNLDQEKWEHAGSIPLDAPVTTTAVKSGNFIWIPSGEIRAGVRTPNILVGRLSEEKLK